MKTLFTTTIIFAVFTAQAQDTITKISGERIFGKVTEVAPLEIKYKRADLPDGPTFTEKVSNVAKISYPGRVESYTQGPANTATTAKQETETKQRQPVDMSKRFIVTLNNGTQLHGKMISENEKEIVFEDNNIGQKTIGRDKIKAINLQYGDMVRVFTLK